MCTWNGDPRLRHVRKHGQKRTVLASLPGDRKLGRKQIVQVSLPGGRKLGPKRVPKQAARVSLQHIRKHALHRGQKHGQRRAPQRGRKLGQKLGRRLGPQQGQLSLPLVPRQGRSSTRVLLSILLPALLPSRRNGRNRRSPKTNALSSWGENSGSELRCSLGSCFGPGEQFS
jgi:hypothetical protein